MRSTSSAKPPASTSTPRKASRSARLARACLVTGAAPWSDQGLRLAVALGVPGRGERPRRVGTGRRRGRGTVGSALAVAALLRGDDAPWNGDAAIEHIESWRGADDDTEPASANVPGVGGYVNARELVAAQLPERLWGGYTSERGDAGSHCGKPPRCDRLLCGGERVHDPESRKCGVSAINEFEAKAVELSGSGALATRAHGRAEARRYVTSRGAIRDNAREPGPATASFVTYGKRSRACSRGWSPGLSEIMRRHL